MFLTTKQVAKTCQTRSVGHVVQVIMGMMKTIGNSDLRPLCNSMSQVSFLVADHTDIIGVCAATLAFNRSAAQLR